MNDLNNLRIQKETATDELKKLAKIEDRALTNEECDRYENLEKHIDELENEVRSERTKERIGERMNQPATFSTGVEARPAQDEWSEAMKYWRSCGRIKPDQRASPPMNETDDSGIVPKELLDELISLMGAVSGVRSAVSVQSYPNGVEIPRVATRVSVTATTAPGTAFDATVPTFDTVDFSVAPTATATSEMTVQIMESSRPDLVREILTQHAEELSRFWSTSYCTGLGASDVDTDGIFSGETVIGLNTEETTGAAIAGSDLINLRYSTLPAKYWVQGGPLSWVMGQAAFAEIMALTDSGTDRPMFQPQAEATLANALQGTLLGLPVFIDSGAPAPTTGNACVALLSRDSYRVADRDPGLVSNVNPWAQQNKGIVEVNSYFRSCGRWMRPQAAAVLSIK